MSRPRVAAGALFFDQHGNVLLVKPTYKEGWDIPGGYVEPGETPSEACEREIREELGIDVAISRLLAVDWAPSGQEGDKVLFVFDGGALEPDAQSAFNLPEDELRSFAFQPPQALDNLMPGRLARRLRAAITAQQSGEVTYLEHGSPVADPASGSRSATDGERRA
jgi:8-oxo-dGTP pyrophosphatase MutT (NUDIX family)